MRAEAFQVMRRKPVQGYDISFLITNYHCKEMQKQKLIDFIVQFMENTRRFGDSTACVNGVAVGCRPKCEVPIDSCRLVGSNLGTEWVLVRCHWCRVSSDQRLW
ncbi:uncharacterized protein LOC120164142 isoform X2 [Hibiscus syriacus]|uniref:uncharacterized protein LOC120164142 isoform X2 n=1 Tax=Hibiscus syriacus TaxID=106335 RepID=UPI0019250FA7|nr:uncharacterized protein LOC120164142 isoform X2 [Hibiscus syriacus]